MPRSRYDITRIADPDKVRTFIENCQRAGDDEGIRTGQKHLFRVLAEQAAADLPPEVMRDPLVVRFLEMTACVEELRGTRASRTRNSLKGSSDKIATIERLLRQWARKGSKPEDGTETFHFLNKAGRLDLTGEALLLEFRDRFVPDAQAIAEARERLAYYGYPLAVELRRKLAADVDAERARAREGMGAISAKKGLARRDATIHARANRAQS